MGNLKNDNRQIKYLTPNNLHEQIKNFTSGMAVTQQSFELLVENCTLQDFEWNHMDQQHRPSIHNTYEKGIRIAMGENFAISLTQWKNWPIFITVTDVYVAEGLFYQSLTIAGIIFLHSIISMEQKGDNVLLRDEWFIASHKLFKILHKPLNKKLYKLNERLQEEDAQIRHGRFALRKLGYTFRSDPPNYCSSNTSVANTIYPVLPADTNFSTDNFMAEISSIKLGNIEFLLKKENETDYLIWPAACPHEGGPLAGGKFCDAQITCPWHGLRFSAARLSTETPQATRYGFEYTLIDNNIYVKQITVAPQVNNLPILERA